MKFVPFVLTALLIAVDGNRMVDTQEAAKVETEDSSFWQRFVAEADSMSLTPGTPPPVFVPPPPEPTASPTPGGTPSGTSSPTPAGTPVGTASPTPGGTTAPPVFVPPPPTPTASPTPGGTPSGTAVPTPGGTTAPPVYVPPPPVPTAAPSAPTVPTVCNVTVGVTCLSEGQDCQSLTSKTPETCTTPIEELKFLFTNCTCGCSENMQGSSATCQFTKPFDGSPVTVACSDSAGAPVTVTPTTLVEGSIFTVNSTAGTLPSTLFCTFSQNGEVVQSISLDTSGATPLVPLNKFGGSQVVACDDQTCLAQTCYNYTITNIGTGSLEVTSAERSFNGASTSFLNFLPTTSLEAGQSTAIGECREINVCKAFSATTDVTVEADSTSGEMCEASASYSYTISGPGTPAPGTSPPISAPSGIPGPIIPGTLAPVTTPPATTPPATTPPAAAPTAIPLPITPVTPTIMPIAPSKKATPAPILVSPPAGTPTVMPNVRSAGNTGRRG